MPVDESAPRRRRSIERAALLASVSAVTLLATGAPAQARDVLRGVSPVSSATAAGLASAQQAAAVAKLSQDALARATQSIQAMRTVQSAARNLALVAPSTISDGLSANPGLTPGLVPDSGLAASGVANPVTSWIGAQTPTQATSNGQTAVTIQQTAPQALLNWSSFNVSKNTTVDFNQQGKSSWVALNKITDSAGAPSRILGSIRADGSVYLINQNGIIFGGSSQINVHTLIASSLDLNDSYATAPSQSNFLNGKGILSTNNLRSFQSVDAGNGAAYSAGAVTVSAGAQITASGGAVVLLAPVVQNDGAITTPSGQTMLVGASDVMLSTGDSYIRGFVLTPNPNAPNPNVPKSFFASTTPGTVINNGAISAPQGNITIVAGQVTQNGVLTSTTSTTKNGSIVIQAQTGNLVLGGANDNPLYGQYGAAPQPSLVQIVPDAADTALITDTQAIANSSIALTGVNVDVRGIVQLHGYAVVNATNPNTNDPAPGITITATGTPTAAGKVFLENGSLLDASGTTGATASASRNSVAVELRTNELRNSPLVKAGRLYQKTIYVDASASGTSADGSTWVGTPLADASAWIGLTTRSLAERMMNGAPITIGGAVVPAAAGGSAQLGAQLVQAPGSIINVSGGYLTYTPGFVRVTKLVTADGHLFSASNADPTLNYVAICCSSTTPHPHWGVNETFSTGLVNPGAPLVSQGYFNPGYVQGGVGGSLTLAVSSAVLGGTIYASVVAGPNQQTLATAPAGGGLLVNSANPLPASGTFTTAYFNADQINLSDAATATATGWAADFDIGTDLNTLLTANSAPPNSVYLPASWLNSGFKRVSLGANVKVALSGSGVVLPAGGSFSANANTVDIRSSVRAPGGTIALTGDYTGASALVDAPSATFNLDINTVSATSAVVTIGPGVTLSAAGLWTNRKIGAPDAPIAADGGTITLGSYGNIALGQGSILDVSGGGSETATGKITGGNGGSLTLVAGLKPTMIPNYGGPPLPYLVVPLGHVDFIGGLAPGQLKGHGVAGSSAGKGGMLALTTSDVVTLRSSGALVSQVSSGNWAGSATLPASPTTYTPAVVDVSTEFFSSGGFANVSLTATGITLPAAVTLAPTVAALQVVNPAVPSATSLSGIAQPVVLASGLRQAASITLHATGDLWNGGANVDPRNGSLAIAGTIRTDPHGSVTLTGDQIAIIDGTVSAPAGTITLSGGTYKTPSSMFASQSPVPLNGEGVWLTGNGRLLATGTPIAVPQSNGMVFDDVLPGGTVTVSGGDVILAPGSAIDVSGATGNSSLLAAGSGVSSGGVGLVTRHAALTTPVTVSSAGGTISIAAVLGAVLEGTLAGKSGGGNAAGGTLSVTLTPHNGSNAVPAGLWPIVRDSYLILQSTVQPGDADYVSAAQLGQPGSSSLALNDPNNLYNLIDARIPISIAQIGRGGFSSLALSFPGALASLSPSGTTTGVGYVTFAGNATLKLANQVVVNAGTILVPYGANDAIQANYFQWNGGAVLGKSPAVPSATGAVITPSGVISGTLSIVANTVDLVGDVAVQGAQNPSGSTVGQPLTSFTVAGDLRLTGVRAVAAQLQSAGSLVSAGELDFRAGQIYPSTETSFTLASATKIVFTANGAPPPAPLSVGGVLNVYAPEIDQAGTLRAPTGTINLGSLSAQSFDFATDTSGVQISGVAVQATAMLNLGAGGLTSVSADGQTSLFGYVQNGTAWFYDPSFYNPNSANSGAGGFPIAAPPAKLISLAGANVAVAPGALLDASGGGDLFAGEFVPGTNGSKDIFTPGSGPNVYAVLPSYAGITPYDPQVSAGAPAVGQHVYLNGVPGLAAGTYTLLPGSYAQLPGAFLVNVQIAPGAGAGMATRTPIPAAALTDGSYVASGYFKTPGAGTTDEHWSLFRVMPGTVARKYSEIDNNLASQFFKNRAQANGTAIPRLPQDGGQLSIVVATSLNFQGAGSFTPAPGGLGGLADISANQILVVDSATRDAINAGTVSVASYRPGGSAVGGATDPDVWSPIVLAASDLNRLGVESLLLGGTRSFQNDGVHVTTSATAVVVANDAKDPLVRPDIQFIAQPELTTNNAPSTNPAIVPPLQLVSATPGTGQVIIAPNAAIQASGAVAPGGTATYILCDTTCKETVPTPNILSQYSSADVATYYQEAAANQFGYLRLSGGGLVTISGGNATYAGLATGAPLFVGPGFYVLPSYAIGGSVSVGSGAQLISDNSLTMFASGSGRVASGVTITAQQVLLKSGQISFGTDNYAVPGLVLGQAALDSLAGVKALTLVGASEIDLYGGLSLGRLDPTGQPILGSLTFDSAALVEKGNSGIATFTAEQVTFQNSLGGSVAPMPPVGGTALAINALDVLGKDPSGAATGYNNATISLGVGAVTLAGFGAVDLKSSGQIVGTGAQRSGNQILIPTGGAVGSLAVEAPLTLDAPRISGGVLTTDPISNLPVFGTSSYTITAADNPASPVTYYPVALINSSGASPVLPTPLLGNSLTVTGGQISIGTNVVLPGGAFSATANGGSNLTVGAQGVIDVSGAATRYVDALASIGGGNITLTSSGGAIAIQAGVVLNVGDLAGVGALNQTSAGTLTLAAPTGGVTIAAGTLHGEGPGADSAGSFILDTNTLATAGQTYDALASVLVAGGFAKSWDIRARAGNITMGGLTSARSVTVSADSGNIDVAGVIDASGATGGKISLWAGKDLTVEATAVLNAHGAIADASGRGGQVWLGASQAGDQQGTLILTVGATIDVTADRPNSINAGPVFGGQVTLSASRNAGNNNIMLSTNGGTFADFLTGIKGESAWDGVVVVGNKVYSYNDATLYLTPSTTVAASGGVETAAFTTYLNDANLFMNNQSTLWSAFGANGSTGVAHGVLVNIRPGIVIKNRGGDITIEGDATNEKGIDLSGSAYAGSVLNTGDSQTLNGHFGQYDAPVVLSIRAAGNLNFGSYTSPTLPGVPAAGLPTYLTLGTLSDGFSQYTGGLAQYRTQSGVLQGGDVSLGAGASAWAAPFDPAAPGSYNGLSGGLGASSATYLLTAGADLAAADPLKTNPSASGGTMTVAGVSVNFLANPGGTPFLLTPTIQGTNFLFPVTTNPLYLYNFSWSGGNQIASGTGPSPSHPLPLDWTQALGGTTTQNATIFADYASLIRTGTGNIRIATGKDLVLQSPLSLIYTAGTGYNVNGTSGQPLSGFTQYSGILNFGSTSGANARKWNFNYLFPATFPTLGGDLILTIGGSIKGAMNNVGLYGGNVSLQSRLQEEDLPYDMTALGSQLKLENWITQDITQFPTRLIGSFNALYATGNWLNDLPAASNSFYTAGTSNNLGPSITGATAAADTPGNYQLAWFTQFPYLQNTIGSFGGGNITVKVGGGVSNVQFVAPTNARDAGPYLVASRYAYDPNVVQNAANVGLARAGLALTDPNDPFGNNATPIVGGYTGLYTQGGGNVSVTAGGDVTNVYTYVQNGATTLQTRGSASQLFLATASGNVSVQAIGAITIKDQIVGQDIGNSLSTGAASLTLSGISLIQNASILADLVPFGRPGGGGKFTNGASYILDNVLTGILTSAPTGSVTLNAVGTVTLDVSTSLASPWNTNQGVLPAQVNLISLGGDVVNQASFTTYPDPAGTINLLARGSIVLSSGVNGQPLSGGFNLSDADPRLMPTLENIVGVLAPFQTVVTAANATTATLSPGYDRLYPSGIRLFIGGANYVAGQDTGITTSFNATNSGFLSFRHPTVLQGDSPIQLIPSLELNTSLGSPIPDPVVEAERHAGLHAGNTDPARIIALNGDVAQPTPLGFVQVAPAGPGGSFIPQQITISDPYENLTKAVEIFAGRDVQYLSLLGQNNNATDVTSVVAGRDVIHPVLGTAVTQTFGIYVGGPGNLVVQSGRNVDLGTSTGIQTFGNFLNRALPSEGAGITIETGLGSSLGLPDYAAFTAQFVNPATATANKFAEPLQLFDANGNAIGSGRDAFAYLQTLSSAQQQILLNRIFFGLVRDSGREHTGAAAGGNYEMGTEAIDTAASLNAAYANYQRAFAAVGAFLGGTSGSGSFLGGLSTVRTLGGGDITILSPHGQIQVGQVAPPTGFPGYSLPDNPLWALNFGVVTEKGGNVRLYADGNISVNQSRVFTLEGGDLTVVSKNGDIDAGKGAKTVLSVQPANVSYDPYGNITVTPYGPASGSGLAVLRALPDVPLGNADLIAFAGIVDAGDAGIRVSGNLNIAAVQILNAGNIQVQGTTTGIPTAVAPNIGALTGASNQAGAAANAAADAARQSRNRPPPQDLPSIITVEVIGYGGDDSAKPRSSGDTPEKRPRPTSELRTQDPNSAYQVLGAGALTAAETDALIARRQQQVRQ